ASRRTRRLGWLAALLLFVALALGPELHLDKATGARSLPLGLPMPYQALQAVPLLQVGRAPARFAAPATLCLALLAAQGVVALRRRVARPDRVAAWCALLVGLELLAVPFPVEPLPTSPVYQALAAQPCRGPLFEIPVD